MVSKISNEDYKVLELYLLGVLKRAGVEEDKMATAIGALMHPITALLDDGDASQEFLPYMRNELAKWKGKNAPRS